MRKVTQAQNPYWFTLWLWSSLYRSRSVRLQDLDFDNNSKWYKEMERRPLCTTFNSFNRGLQKIHQSRKNQDYLFNGQP
jgi:hypothetical protein